VVIRWITLTSHALRKIKSSVLIKQPLSTRLIIIDCRGENKSFKNNAIGEHEERKLD
jgi:hypothetical protein